MPASPSLLDAQSGAIVARLNALTGYFAHHAQGGIVGAPTTPSVQSSGAGATLALRVNVAALMAVVDGVATELGAQGDYVAHNAAFWSATSGSEARWAIVLSTGSGNDTPAIADVAGAEAADGAGVAPTDAAITTALGHANWIRLANIRIRRTADTTLVETYDNTVRPFVAQYGADLAETEAAFRA